MTDETEAISIIVRAIITKGALTVSPEKPFRWASGYAMPVYIDNRGLLGYPEVRKAIAEAFAAQIKKNGQHFDAIAGVATGAIPHATTLADLLGLPLLYVRPKPKDHGAGRQVEGNIEGGIAGKNILVIEDTISTGSSVINAITALRNEGAIVSTCSVIYFYDFQGQPSKFEEMTPPCTLNPLITFPILLDIAQKEGLLDPKIIEELQNWYKDPFQWGTDHGMPPLTP